MQRVCGIIPISLLVIIQTLATLSNSQSTNKVLALYFSNLPASTSNIDAVVTEFSARVASALNRKSEEIRFGSLKPTTKATEGDAAAAEATTKGSFLPFTIDGTDLKVVDSASTPDTFTTYSQKWQDALKQTEAAVGKPFKFGEIEVAVDLTQHEAAAEQQPVVGDDDDSDPVVKSGDDYNEMVLAVGNRPNLMQLRLKNANLNDYSQSWSSFNYLVGGTRSVLSTVLGVPIQNVIFSNVKSGSVIAQFTVHPADDVNELNEKWATAVKDKHPAIAKVFSDFDYEFPALGGGCLGNCKSGGQKKKGPSAAVVAGAVFGGIAVCALIGGGTAGWFYYRRQKKITDKTPLKKARQDFDTPGAIGVTPGALSTINIQGEITPNPNNY